MSTPKMIIIGGVRYREEDARRLGFTGPGGVTPVRKDETPPEPEPEPAKAPAKSASKELWITFALANGLTEEDLEGLTRDEIAARFTQ